ncbi:MAG: DUF1330 domain-containing protein [Rhodothermales bacterium]
MDTSTPTAYIDATQDAGRQFVMRRLEGPVVMLNLLRFRAEADYSASPELAPAAPISGAEAYERYIAHTLPFLEAAGGTVLFSGMGGPWLIGPAAEQWDRVLLVQHQSAAVFLAFARNPEYLAGMGHRTAALADSRLLPIVKDRA